MISVPTVVPHREGVSAVYLPSLQAYLAPKTQSLQFCFFFKSSAEGIFYIDFQIEWKGGRWG